MQLGFQVWICRLPHEYCVRPGDVLVVAEDVPYDGEGDEVSVLRERGWEAQPLPQLHPSVTKKPP